MSSSRSRALAVRAAARLRRDALAPAAAATARRLTCGGAWRLSRLGEESRRLRGAGEHQIECVPRRRLPPASRSHRLEPFSWWTFPSPLGHWQTV